MPNWCNNTNIFWTTKEYKDELEGFFRFIKEQNAIERKDGLGLTWLADLLDASGLQSDQYNCRGYLTYLSPSLTEKKGYISFELDTDTAWRPMPAAMEALLTAYPHVYLSYAAEELGTGIFVTNDREGDFFTDVWHIECFLDGDEDTCQAVYQKYPLLVDLDADGEAYLTEEEGEELFQELFQLQDIPETRRLEVLPQKVADFQQRLKEEFPKLEDCILVYQHIDYV